MSDDFRVQFMNLMEFSARLKQAPEIVKAEMTLGINRLTLAGERASKKLAPKDTGHLRRSITAKPATSIGGVVEGKWGTNVPYAEVMEKGRGAGKPMPPAGALLAWMGRHPGGTTTRTKADGTEVEIPIAQREFALRRAIGLRGITGKEYMKGGKTEIEPFVVKEFQAIAQRIIRRLGS